MIMKGQKISDRYQIIKSVGEGGMANVYLAYDTILDREVAVKVLRGDLASDEKFVRRFQREALSASSLSNPNIVEVYDVGEDDGEYYIVMEYVEGKHLKNLLKKRGKLTISEVVDIAVQITNGLSVAHDSYLIHRDIKPQNILILDNGLLKITDFGIAVAMNATQLTQTNSVMGSVHYLPPEQAMGKAASLQSDIYSIGIVLYELLAGKLPFTGDNAVEIALKHLKETVPEVTTVVSNVPQSLANIILKATAKNPKNRYSDAREMHEDLKTCLDDKRKNEPKISLKYPETDYDETKVMKIVKTEQTKNDNKDGDEEQIAKKITKKDLKKQNKTLIILGGIFTALIVVITTVVLLIPVLTSTEKIKIPDVTGMSQAEAIDTLQDAGFSLADEVIEKSDKDIEEGMVIKTNPLAGSERKAGSEITLYISIGNTSLVIEDYSGKNADVIKGSLETLGLQVLIEQKIVEDLDLLEEYDGNEIIAQSVEAGVELSEGDIITLYIPNINIFPDFTDTTKYDIDDAKSFANEHNLPFKIIYDSTSTLEKDTIIKQSRAAGTPIVEGEEFTITVAGADEDVVNGDENQNTTLSCKEDGTC